MVSLLPVSYKKKKKKRALSTLFSSATPLRKGWKCDECAVLELSCPLVWNHHTAQPCYWHQLWKKKQDFRQSVGEILFYWADAKREYWKSSFIPQCTVDIHINKKKSNKLMNGNDNKDKCNNNDHETSTQEVIRGEKAVTYYFSETSLKSFS